MKGRNILYIVIVVVIAIAVALQWYHQKNSKLVPTTKKTTVQTAPPAKTDSSEAPDYPLDQASSLWAVVNKGRILPASYLPTLLVVPNIPLRENSVVGEMHLRSEAAKALEQMAAAGKSDGIHLMLASGFRSYDTQVTTYNSEVSAYGQAKADTESARPGHSEHQTGLAADLEPSDRSCEIADCFADTPEGKWLAANSYRYGFVIRYQQNNQNLTGYRYEPWHVRYVGDYLAGKLHSSSQTLEQYFNLPAFVDYPAQSTALRS